MQFPKIMGILNATPDSFSDGTGGKISLTKLYWKAKRLAGFGADIIDIGGESTKPNAVEISVEEELQRILPLIKKIKQKMPKIPISVDTRKAEVAEVVLKLGVNYINDISGLTYSPEIAEIAAKYNAKLIIMHSRPHDVQQPYKNVINEVYEFLQQQIEFACSAGVDIKNIIADVGIGFGKNYEDNIEILRKISHFASLGVPQLLGISRKRFIGNIIGEAKPQKRDIATIFLHSLLLTEKPIEIIRVHNVVLAEKMRVLHRAIL